MQWIDRLAYWWLTRRYMTFDMYGTWTIVPEGFEWKTVEKFPVPGLADPYEMCHTVGIKVYRKVSA